MFAWAPIPEPFRQLGSVEFSKLLIEKADVAVSPGIGFGEYGEGFVRIALVENEHRIRQAARNIKKFLAQGTGDDAQRHAAVRDKRSGRRIDASSPCSASASPASARSAPGVLANCCASTATGWRRALGRRIEVAGVSARDRATRTAASPLDGVEWFDDPVKLAAVARRSTCSSS